jgi:hypothetical protein
MGLADHMNQFKFKLDSHLQYLSNINAKAYVDTGPINLQNISDNYYCADYFNTIISKLFMHTITKSTHFQDNSHSAIDNILNNDIN